MQTFCGLQVSDELIRQVTLAEGAKIAAWQATAPEGVAAFAQAEGDAEFETDAVKVNTGAGWRDAKIGIFAVRSRGEAAATAQWADRKLPKPTARYAFAAIADSERFAQAWAATAVRLAIDPRGRDLTVLGDGAEWIWNRAAEQFPQAAGVLDIFHAVEYVADACKARCGEGTDLAQQRRERGTTLLLSDG